MKVLFVVHGFPPWAVGGTEVYVHDLAVALHALGDELHVLTREADPGRKEGSVRTESRGGISVTIVNNTFRECRSFEETYRNRGIRAIAAGLIDELGPDICHVHHLTCLSTDLLEVLAERGIPTVCTLNDYWLLCQRGQLLDVGLARCDGPYPEGCARCLGARSSEVEARLAHVRQISRHVSVFFTPSRTLRERFLSHGFPGPRLVPQEQGIDVRPLARVERRPSPKPRFGFLGSLMVSKAPHLLLLAAALLPADTFEVHVFGGFAPYHGDESYREVLGPLLGGRGVVDHGPVPHARVADAFAAFDVLVVPSVWIENAPFVIKEAYAAGVPVVASRLGGMTELVAHERSGLLFRVGDEADLARTLLRFVEEPDLLPRLRAGLPTVKSIEADARETREAYAGAVGTISTSV